MSTARAIRYSGDVVISIVYSDKECEYTCRLMLPNGEENYQVVSPPPCLDKPVDSPEAFDEVASAALSFALAESQPVSEIDSLAASDFEGTGWHIGRTKEERWPKQQD